MTKLAIAACVAASILVTPRVFAQEHEHRHEDGSALGEVNFPVSCNAQAQPRFNTLAALLYSFYWERIDAAVAAVLEADPACAMAYWAKAVASLDNPLGAPPTPKLEQEGWAAVEQAKQLGGKTHANANTSQPSRPSSKITRPFRSRRAQRRTSRR